MFNKDDVVFIIENNSVIRKAKVARKQGDNYIIQLIGSCGALTLAEDQLYATKDAAAEAIQQMKLNSANVTNMF